DQLAAILMLRFADLDETPQEVTDNLGLAANWMLSRSTGAYNLAAYADEHALAEQRYFNLQCLIYGTDPEGFASMVDSGDLTAARAAHCPGETVRVTRAWVRLLVPYLAPGHEAYREEAMRYLARTRSPGPQTATASGAESCARRSRCAGEGAAIGRGLLGPPRHLAHRCLHPGLDSGHGRDDGRGRGCLPFLVGFVQFRQLLCGEELARHGEHFLLLVGGVVVDQLAEHLYPACELRRGDVGGVHVRDHGLFH